jgi:hypothetical protein
MRFDIICIYTGSVKWELIDADVNVGVNWFTWTFYLEPNSFDSVLILLLFRWLFGR